jgi:hypothetical protein
VQDDGARLKNLADYTKNISFIKSREVKEEWRYRQKYFLVKNVLTNQRERLSYKSY